MAVAASWAAAGRRRAAAAWSCRRRSGPCRSTISPRCTVRVAPGQRRKAIENGHDVDELNDRIRLHRTWQRYRRVARSLPSTPFAAADCHELPAHVAIASAVETDHTMTETPPEDHHKVSHWDRPKPPHDWRWVVGGIGRALITLGLLMFGFVAYQLWGTGIQTAQAQRQLVQRLRQVGRCAELLDHHDAPRPATDHRLTDDDRCPADDPTTVPAPSTTTTTTLPGSARGQAGPGRRRGAWPDWRSRAWACNRIVVEGATAGDLAKGPGHFPETPLPGQLGNAAIAGHRTTHLHPFYDIDKLQPGDEIIVTTLNGRYVYSVTGTEVVSPDDYAAVIPTTDATKATLDARLVHAALLVDQPHRRAFRTRRREIGSTHAAGRRTATEPTSSEPTLPDEERRHASDHGRRYDSGTDRRHRCQSPSPRHRQRRQPTTPADGVEPDGIRARPQRRPTRSPTDGSATRRPFRRR